MSPDLPIILAHHPPNPNDPPSIWGYVFLLTAGGFLAAAIILLVKRKYWLALGAFLAMLGTVAAMFLWVLATCL